MPKILLITADQWRGDCLGRLGHDCVQTPHLDALAADGVQFARHYAQCTPCGPSRASLHTGMYLMNHRSARNGTPLSSRFTNAALELRKTGMRPALIGYTDTSVDPRGYDAADAALHTYGSVLPGFEQLVPESEGPVAWVNFLRARGYDFEVATHHEDEPDVFEPDPNFPGAADRGPTFAPARYPAELSDTAFSVNHAIDYLRGHAGRDWFLHLSLLRPHPPFIAPAPYHDMYEPDAGPAFKRHDNAAAEASLHPYFAYGQAIAQKFRNDYGMDMASERDQRQLRATYWGMVSEVDTNLGRLFSALRETGDYDDTLIVFTTDHGEQLWDHWWIGKQSCFEQSFHIPLIVRAPATPEHARGTIVHHFTEAVDIVPTLCEHAGLAIPAQCDGEALTPWLQGNTPSRWREYAFYELDFREVVAQTSEQLLQIDMESCNLAAIRGERYKYVHFPTLPPLLYDLQEDPDELHNLAEDPAYAGQALKCAQQLLSHRMRHAERSLTGVQLTRAEGLVRADEGRRRAVSG